MWCMRPFQTENDKPVIKSTVFSFLGDKNLNSDIMIFVLKTPFHVFHPAKSLVGHILLTKFVLKCQCLLITSIMYNTELWKRELNHSVKNSWILQIRPCSLQHAISEPCLYRFWNLIKVCAVVNAIYWYIGYTCVEWTLGPVPACVCLCVCVCVCVCVHVCVCWEWMGWSR